MLSYFFLPSQKAILLLIPYHFTIPLTSKNSIFIKILLFNLSLLFLSIRYCLGVIPFFWAFQPFFFSQAPSTSSTNHKHKPTPIKKNHHQTRFETQTRPEQTITTTQPRFETQPIWNPLEQTHSKKIIIGATSATTQPQPQPMTHFNRRSMTNDPFIPTRRSTTNDPLQLPIHDQRPASSQLADPQPQPNHTNPQPTTHNHADPQPTTTTNPCRHPRPKHRTHNPTTNHDQRPKHQTQQRRKREGRERREQRMKREKRIGGIKFFFFLE